MTGGLGVPMRWLAGNHDEGLALQHICAGTGLAGAGFMCGCMAYYSAGFIGGQ